MPPPAVKSTTLPTLVLLPGLDGSGDMFSPLLQALGRLPGSALPVQVLAYSGTKPQSYAELEAELIPQLPRTPYVLLGESFSGPLALSIAARRPADLHGLIFCCSFACNPRPSFQRLDYVLNAWPATAVPPHLLTRLASPCLLGRFATPALVQLLRHALRQVSGHVIARRASEIIQLDMSAKLAFIKVPALYVQALHDRLVPASALAVFHAGLPQLQTAALPGPHCLLQALPAEAAGVIRHFMATLPPSLPDAVLPDGYPDHDPADLQGRGSACIRDALAPR